MEISKDRAALIAAVAVAGTIATAVVVALAWPALTRPDPPAEAEAGAEGVRINLVEPPKATVTRSSPLDVGLSEAALAMAKGREAPPDGSTPAPLPSRPTARGAPEPVETTSLLVEDDAVRPPDRFDDAARERLADERYEDARRAQWEREQRIEADREAAWARERAEDRRRREARDDDARYPPPPSDDRAPPPEPW